MSFIATLPFVKVLINPSALLHFTKSSICFRKSLSMSSVLNKNLRIAIIGQSVFGQEVYNLLKKQGKNIVGVFTVPDQNGRADPLAAQAEKDGIPLFKFQRWRLKG